MFLYVSIKNDSAEHFYFQKTFFIDSPYLNQHDLWCCKINPFVERVTSNYLNKRMEYGLSTDFVAEKTCIYWEIATTYDSYIKMCKAYKYPIKFKENGENIMFANTKEVERLKKHYPAGTRIILHYMEDARAVPVGSLGTVRTVDDAGTIHVDWDCGRRLGVIPGEDSFEIIRD